MVQNAEYARCGTVYTSQRQYIVRSDGPSIVFVLSSITFIELRLFRSPSSKISIIKSILKNFRQFFFVANFRKFQNFRRRKRKQGRKVNAKLPTFLSYAYQNYQHFRQLYASIETLNKKKNIFFQIVGTWCIHWMYSIGDRFPYSKLSLLNVYVPYIKISLPSFSLLFLQHSQ